MIPNSREQSNLPQVSSLLHTLRGEAFRHQRNIQGVRVSVQPPPQGPSLPPLSTGETDAQRIHPTSLSKTAGPPPPRSWISSYPASPLPSSFEWRNHALSLILRNAPSPSLASSHHPSSRLPSLFHLCLHNLLLKWGGIPPELFPTLPRHILREYMRYNAIHGPSLPREDLEALWSIDNAGSADGEVIITGPFADLVLLRPSSGSSNTIPRDWDFALNTTEPEPPPVLHTFIVLSSPFTPSLLSMLPPTLTHLALLNVQKLPLHSLPAQLPLIAVLDLSFNPWIGAAANKVVKVEWRRWTNLRLLGMRECGLSTQEAQALEWNVNRGRIASVEIILSEPCVRQSVE